MITPMQPVDHQAQELTIVNKWHRLSIQGDVDVKIIVGYAKMNQPCLTSIQNQVIAGAVGLHITDYSLGLGGNIFNCV
jgi:hypothetical protein